MAFVALHYTIICAGCEKQGDSARAYLSAPRSRASVQSPWLPVEFSTTHPCAGAAGREAVRWFALADRSLSSRTVPNLSDSML